MSDPLFLSRTVSPENGSQDRPDAGSVVPAGQMLSMRQAADILNVSRPFLISLLDKGEIAHTKVGRHRRIKADHLFAYKRTRDAKRSDALSALAEMDAEYF